MLLGYRETRKVADDIHGVGPSQSAVGVARTRLQVPAEPGLPPTNREGTGRGAGCTETSRGNRAGRDAPALFFVGGQLLTLKS